MRNVEGSGRDLYEILRLNSPQWTETGHADNFIVLFSLFRICHCSFLVLSSLFAIMPLLQAVEKVM